MLSTFKTSNDSNCEFSGFLRGKCSRDMILGRVCYNHFEEVTGISVSDELFIVRNETDNQKPMKLTYMTLRYKPIPFIFAMENNKPCLQNGYAQILSAYAKSIYQQGDQQMWEKIITFIYSGSQVYDSSIPKQPIIIPATYRNSFMSSPEHVIRVQTKNEVQDISVKELPLIYQALADVLIKPIDAFIPNMKIRDGFFVKTFEEIVVTTPNSSCGTQICIAGTRKEGAIQVYQSQFPVCKEIQPIVQ